MQVPTSDQYIEFGIGNEHFAIKISDIHEIIKLQPITELPNVRSYVKGVINLRGKIVPVLSLRQLFRLPDEAPTKSARIIVVNHMEETVGIIVEHVSRVTTFPEIQPPPERLGSVEGTSFVGLGFSSSGLVGILKLDEVLVKEA